MLPMRHALSRSRREIADKRPPQNIFNTIVDWKETGLKLANESNIKAVNYSKANASNELVTTSCTTARQPEDELQLMSADVFQWR